MANQGLLLPRAANQQYTTRLSSNPRARQFAHRELDKRPGAMRRVGEQEMLLNKPLDRAHLRSLESDDSDWDRITRGLEKIVPGLDLALIDENKLWLATDRFNYGDILLGARALWLARHPVVERGLPSVNDRAWIVDDAFDDTFLADSLQVALTDVLHRVLDDANFPEYIVVDAGKVTILFRDDSVTRITRLDFGPEPDEASVSRITNTLCGVWEHASPASEFIRRILRLPGWRGTRILPGKDLDIELRSMHFSLAKEWRGLARHVLKEVGVSEASPKQIEDVICLMMEAPSWHQLAAALEAARTDSRGADVYCTYLKPSEDQRLHVKYHRSLVAAFTHLIASVQAMGVLDGCWQDIELILLAAEGDFQEMQFQPRMAPGEVAPAWVMERPMDVCPHHAPDEVHALTYKLFGSVAPLSSEALERFFSMHVPDRERIAEADRVLKMRAAVEHGDQRVYIGPRYGSQQVCLHLIAPNGERAPGSSAWADQGQSAVVYCAAKDAHVLVDKWDEHIMWTKGVLDGWPIEKVTCLSSMLDPVVQNAAQQRVNGFGRTALAHWNKEVGQKLIEQHKRRRALKPRGKANKAALQLV
jgi:hypothetical protein